MQAMDALGAKDQFRERKLKQRAHLFARPVVAHGADPFLCRRKGLRRT